MATAFLSLSRIFASFQALFACLVARSNTSRSQAAGQVQQPPAGPALKPVRVVRMLEPSAPRSTAGRMVISGRLADVCAELDRLVALEAQGC
jgi:hypothetical protein